MKLLNNQYLFYWLFALVARVLPIGILIHHFELLNPEVSRRYRIGIILMMGFIWVGLKFWSDIKEFALDMPEGFIRELTLSVASVVPYALVYGVGLYAVSLSDDFMFFASTLLWTQALGVLFKANHKRIRRATLKERGYVNVLR